MTAAYAFEGEPASLKETVLFNCLQRILGAGGNKSAAGGTVWRYVLLIEADCSKGEPFHDLNQLQRFTGVPEGLFKITELSVDGFAAGDNDKIISDGKHRGKGTIDFPESSFYSVSDYSMTELGRDRVTGTVPSQSVFPAINHKVRCNCTFPLRVYPMEIAVLFYSIFLIHYERSFAYKHQ